MPSGRQIGRPLDWSLIGPATEMETIDISSTDHTLAGGKIAKGLYVGGLGDVVVKQLNTALSDVTFKAVPVGTILPIQFKVIEKTSTTATLMIALL